MLFASTNASCPPCPLDDAVNRCVAADGGMFMPQVLPHFPQAFFNNISEMTLADIAYVVATTLLGDDVPAAELKSITADSFAYEAPMKELGDNHYVLELFHGPTLTFKDYGARFMARLMRYLDRRSGNVRRNVLVATTGNTGSAAANGLFRLEGISVSVLYPKGYLSKSQTAQFTALGENIHPIEVAGNVEDCKRLVQQAISDESMQNYHLTGANSINVARILPQIAFTMYAYSRLKALGVKNAEAAMYSMPCGNCSNLVAAVMAKRMGVPGGRLVAATNANDQLRALMSGAEGGPRHCPVKTFTPSIDMSYPSGWPRLSSLYDGKLELMRREIICAPAVSDELIADTVTDLRRRFGYTIDPHGAVAYAAAEACREPGVPVVSFATGHPAKQLDIMTRITGAAIELPVQLTRFMSLRRHSSIIPPTLPALRKHLLNLNN